MKKTKNIFHREIISVSLFLKSVKFATKKTSPQLTWTNIEISKMSAGLEKFRPDSQVKVVIKAKGKNKTHEVHDPTQ